MPSLGLPPSVEHTRILGLPGGYAAHAPLKAAALVHAMHTGFNARILRHLPALRSSAFLLPFTNTFLRATPFLLRCTPIHATVYRYLSKPAAFFSLTSWTTLPPSFLGLNSH